MAPPTKDEDDRAPGQAAADRVRERHSKALDRYSLNTPGAAPDRMSKAHQRALDRYDLETERALDAYEDSDRESITLVNNINLEDIRRAQGGVDTPAHSLPAAPSGVKNTTWALLRSLPRDLRNKVIAAALLIGFTAAVVTLAVLLLQGKLSIGALLS